MTPSGIAAHTLSSVAKATSLAAIAAAIAATPALAQDEAAAAPEGGTGGLEEILVVARRVSENLQDVPVAVTAFSGVALEQQNAVRVSDIARLTPGLLMREASGSPSALSITLRGQVQRDILATLDPSVGTYVDGIYWARAYGLNANLVDVQSTQVLKGPQGTLFGRNTTGGALLIQTNDPVLSEFSGSLSGTYGRFDERTLTGVLNAPLGDRVALRVAAQRSLRDGYVRDIVSGNRYNDRDSFTARGKLLLQATDNLSLLFSAEYYKSDTSSPERRLQYLVPNRGVVVPAPSAEVVAAAIKGGFPTTYPAVSASGASFTGGVGPVLDYLDQVNGHPNLGGNNFAPFNLAKTQTYGGTASLDTFFGEIKFIGGWRKVRNIANIDLDGSPFAIHQTEGASTLKQYSGELQITGKAFGDAVDFATGVFYFNESGVDGSRSISIPTLNAVTSRFNGQIFNDSMGAYGQATWHITDRLSFTGGLRYSIDDKGLITRNQNINRTTGAVTCQIPTASIAAGCTLRRHNDFEGISYTAGFDYKITDDVLVYAKTSKGFRSGGQNLRATSEASALPFQPETAFSHEGGLKSEFFDRRVRLNLAGYYSTVEDIQRTTLVGLANGGTSTIIGNAGKLRIYGFEAELTAKLFDGFQVSATGAITKPKYLNYREVPSRTNLDGDRRSERFDGVPEYTFSVSANYTHDFDFGKLMLQTDYSWNDSYALDIYSAFLGDPQAVAIDPNTGRTIEEEIKRATTAQRAGILSARASISVMDDSIELAVYGRNLTDDRSRVAALYVAGINYVNATLREPRTFGVQATYRFGQ